MLSALGAATSYAAAALIAGQLTKIGALDSDQLGQLRATVAGNGTLKASWRVRQELAPLFAGSEVQYPDAS
jgi:hypothetical protein